MNVSSVFFSLLFATAVFSLVSSELRDNDSSRIINGSNATRGQFPYQASLRRLNGQSFCGGAILNIQWIITAAQCVHQVRPEFLLVYVGAYLQQGDGFPYFVRHIVNHPELNVRRVQNDVSLIRLRNRILLIPPMVRAIALPTQDIRESGVPVTVSGWGFTRVIFIFYFY